MKGGIIAVLGTILAIVVGFWLFVVVIKVAFKLVGLAIILGLAAAAYFWLKGKFGGGNAR
jgi:hypothetical protein